MVVPLADKLAGWTVVMTVPTMAELWVANLVELLVVSTADSKAVH